jgi:ABC-2 type transport system ATP-binding protein
MTVGYFLNYLEPFYPAWDADYARRLVGQFDLPVDRKLGQLSRGMRMKAALVSSLAFHPRLLVLDEPFSGLDPMVREDLIEGLAECASETTILVSSHDLAEIETFASHVAYLDRGRIRFAEEMQSLSDRFREVEVTLRPGVRPVRELWPSDWLCPQESGTLLRFVDSRFDEEGTRRAIARFLGDGVQMSATPMPLKAVFVAMARSGSQAN